MKTKTFGLLELLTQSEYRQYLERNRRQFMRQSIKVYRFDGLYYAERLAGAPCRTISEMIRQIRHGYTQFPIVYSEFHGRTVYGAHVA